MLPIRACPIAFVLLACAVMARAQTNGRVSLKEDSNHIDVSIDGKVLTQYWFAKRDDRAYARPFFFPVMAPDGAKVTSDQYGQKEHPHHNSLWVGQGDVNGANHWALEGAKTPLQRHIKFEKVEGDTIVEDLEWEGTDHNPMLREQRTMRFLPIGDKAWAIDFEEQFTPIGGPVTFMDTKEAGMVAVRMAKSISDKPTITTAAGVSGEGMKAEKQAWGKAADWCDISGQVDGKEYGVAVLDDPRNPRHPTRWHVRAYGLLAAN
ncbi:MAG TPA: PmoA family protein, partial [Tepidisphaeraceae bacterium]|nr:PmoA family protein [Tepidisphaeraceae bacterium]